MDFDEFVRKTNSIAEKAKTTTDVEAKKKLRNEFFDAAIDYYETFGEAIEFYRENLAGNFAPPNEAPILVGVTTPEPRTKNTSYNETPTKGTIMSTQSPVTSENSAPKTSKVAEKLNSLKPANLGDEKKETVLRRIKLTAAFAAGILTTVTVVVAKSYFNSIDETDENVENDETSESETDN